MELVNHQRSKSCFQAPDTAENGAYVGIGIESSIPNIDAVAFLVDKNQAYWQVISK